MAGNRIFVGVLVATCAAALIIWVVQHQPLKSADEWLQTARQSLDRGDFASAEQAAGRVLETDARSFPAMVIAAHAAALQGDVSRAIEWLNRNELAPAEFAHAQFIAGELLRKEGQLLPAISHYEKSVEIDPTEFDSAARLAFLYGVAARNWEALPYRLQLLDSSR